jgi:hypothetical protein
VTSITADYAGVLELVPMTAHNQWRNSYRTALRACGNKGHQEREADLAIHACVQCLSQIVSERTQEVVEISTALADLRLLKILYGKYASSEQRPG